MRKNIKKHPGKHSSKAIDSDHNTMYMDLELKIENLKIEREELFNFKNIKGQETFQQITSNTTDFSKCFQNGLPLSKQINNWLQVLNAYSRRAFKKIRIKPIKPKQMNKELVKLIDIRNAIVKCNEKRDLLEAVNSKIANLEAIEIRNKLIEIFNQFSEMHA